jgi:tetratricopeptide (TPR) repeat protein
VSIGDIDSAIHAYLEALAIDSESPHCLLQLGNLYARRGLEAEAREVYTKVIAIDARWLSVRPKMTGLWQRLGEVYGKLGEHKKAFTAAHAVCHEAAHEVRVRKVLVSIYGTDGITAEALDRL